MPPVDESPVLLPIVLDRHDDADSDPEFGNRRHDHGWLVQPVLLPEHYQRLVANPFLAVFGLVVWIACVMHVDRLLVPMITSLVAPLSLIGLIFLIQYHCLDCGRTGWVFRWRRHACTAVLERQRARRVRRFRGPNPTVQLVLWTWFVFAVSFLVAVALR